ncbi:MAG: CPBP family intramembrane metalloprotease [Blastocatellia bacterium]|nr:CPBP family intramembrane metalloprotease [Blastocatellia bacterium]
MNEARLLSDERNAAIQPVSLKPFLIFMALFFLVWAIRATALFFIDRSFQSDFAIQAYSLMVKFLLWVVPAFIYVKALDRRNPSEYLKLATSIRKRDFFYAAVAIFLYFAAVLLIEMGAKGRNLDLLYGRETSESLKILLLTSISPLFEEILFRGFVLNKLGESLDFWKANLVTAFLFTAIHWPHWLWRNGFQTSMLTTSAAIFILACFLGYLVRKTNSLWPSVVAHIINNFISGSLRP